MRKIIDKLLKVPKKVWGIGGIIFMILSLVAYGFSVYIDKIEIGSVADWYHTIVNFFPAITQLAEFEGRWIFIVCTVIFVFLFWFSTVYKKKLFIIRHQSMSYDLAEIDEKVKERYYLNEHILQQVGKIHIDNVENIAIEEIDQIATEAQISQEQIAYYGIAHTPLVFRLGFKIGDQNNIMLLHKKRNNTAMFEEWTKGKSGIKIIFKEENKSKKSEDLIVAVSTSLEIQKEHLKSLHSESKHIVYFTANYLGFDNVLSYDDAESLRTDILFNIRELVKKYKIKKIHMAISSSVAFTFFLAQGFSAQHDPEIIVYHYEQGNYPWGIIINGSADSSYVKT